MATTAVTRTPWARDSRSADVEIPGYRSPFRARSANIRDIAAQAMIEKRIEEIEQVHDALAGKLPRTVRNNLRTRLRALEANLEAWFAYDGEREPQAVVVTH
jgi:hypothetical protein